MTKIWDRRFFEVFENDCSIQFQDLFSICFIQRHFITAVVVCLINQPFLILQKEKLKI